MRADPLQVWKNVIQQGRGLQLHVSFRRHARAWVVDSALSATPTSETARIRVNPPGAMRLPGRPGLSSRLSRLGPRRVCAMADCVGISARHCVHSCHTAYHRSQARLRKLARRHAAVIVLLGRVLVFAAHSGVGLCVDPLLRSPRSSPPSRRFRIMCTPSDGAILRQASSNALGASLRSPMCWTSFRDSGSYPGDGNLCQQRPGG